MKMSYLLLGVGFVLAIINPSVGRADDCVAKLTSQQHQVYSSLSAANQKFLMGDIKARDGSLATCEFRGGLLDIVGNFPPDKRDAALTQLVNQMLVKQK